jgi:hypothetical protein
MPVTSEQALQIETLAERTHSTDADLLWLARLCSHEAGLNHLGEVTRVDAQDMIDTLKDYERYIEACAAGVKAVEQLT